jgi:hypothetical protein
MAPGNTDRQPALYSPSVCASAPHPLCPSQAEVESEPVWTKSLIKNPDFRLCLYRAHATSSAGFPKFFLSSPHVPPSSPLVEAEGGEGEGEGIPVLLRSTGAETIATCFHRVEETPALPANVPHQKDPK